MLAIVLLCCYMLASANALNGYPNGACGYPMFEPVGDIAGIVGGAIAKPDKIIIVDGLPKTRSGKIMRRILRKIAENEVGEMGDISTLLDPSVVERIIIKAEKS